MTGKARPGPAISDADCVLVRWLDLYCGQGGVGGGIELAGGTVTLGVDLHAQPRYPYPFEQADAVEYLEKLLAYNTVGRFDAVWASPPCQSYSSRTKHLARPQAQLIGATRELLRATGLPYVIENVPGAPLLDPVQVCGTSVGLHYDGFELRRERLFESNVPLQGLACAHSLPAAPVFGHNAGGCFYKRYGRGYDAAARRALMEMPWATRDGMSEAIPPRMAAFIARQVVQAAKAAA